MTTAKLNLKRNSKGLDIYSKATHASHYRLVEKMTRIKTKVRRKMIKNSMLFLKMIKWKSSWRISASKVSMTWASSQVNMPFNMLESLNLPIPKAPVRRIENWRIGRRRWKYLYKQRTKRSLISCSISWGLTHFLGWLPTSAWLNAKYLILLEIREKKLCYLNYACYRNKMTPRKLGSLKDWREDKWRAQRPWWAQVGLEWEILFHQHHWSNYQ